ncbi:MAG: SBBP repeat-containing protein, partial [Thermoplasmata archaeon]
YESERHQVEGKFVLYDNLEYGFELLQPYQRSEKLIIDPDVTLEYSTFIGSISNDLAYGLVSDNYGNLYITGMTTSTNFPIKPGSYDNTLNGTMDAFISKLDPTGSNLIYSTFLGGSGTEFGRDLVINDLGNVFVTGYTISTDFPTTKGAYDTGHNGNEDVFVMELSANGSAILYSTLIGGSAHDNGFAIDIDADGNAYVTGRTQSMNFPYTYGSGYYGGYDIFVLQLNSDGTSLNFSRYVGGGSGEAGEDIDVDSSGFVYVTGYTGSSDFFTTGGAYDNFKDVGDDAFVFKLDLSTGLFKYSTFIGGDNTDGGSGIILDPSGNTIVTGVTKSTDFPADAYDPSHNGNFDVFVLKLNQAGSNLIFSTYLGDSENDYGKNIDMDSTGNIYITGYTDSSLFPTTPGAYNRTLTGSSDVFLAKFNHNCSTLLYSTFIGGSALDAALAITMDAADNVYLTGYTQSSDFPTSLGVFNRTYGGGSDVFVVKFATRTLIKIYSVSLFKNETPVNTTYTRLAPYTFRVELIDSVDFTDLINVRLSLDPLGCNIQLLWVRATDTFTVLSDPDNYIHLEPSSNSFNFYYWWILNFNITFNWIYPKEELNDVQVYATSKTLSHVWLNDTKKFRVENDLVFNGTLSVKGEDNRIIVKESLVCGGEILNWTGLKVVYEGTTDVYPPADEFDVTIWDEADNYWYDSPDSGDVFFFETVTHRETNEIGFSYTINLSGVPSASDLTNETFVIKIDNDNVTFTKPLPYPFKWQNSTNVEVGITITDVGGSFVDATSIMYAISIENGSMWSDWNIITGLESAVSIQAQDIIVLEEGIKNLIKWKAADMLGNGPVESLVYRILVDTEDVTFSNALPLGFDISPTEEVEISITISDTTSGVNASTIEYAVSNDKGKTWGAWQVVEGLNNSMNVNVNLTLTFFNGTDNMIKWRASDIAGNGPAESSCYGINVNTWIPEMIPEVTLLSPPVGISVNKTTLELSWALYDTRMVGVLYDVYFDNVNPPEINRTGINNTSLLIENLADGEIYYWKVIPKLNDKEGLCRNGVWWFKIDLASPPHPVEERIFKVDISGPEYILLYPGDNVSIQLSITNLGNDDDTIKIELKTGTLSASYIIFDYSPVTLISNTSSQRILIINLPLTAQIGTYEINITVISVGGGTDIKDTQIITLEVQEKETEKEEEDQVEKESSAESNYWIWLILIIIIMIICITVVALYIKRKKVVRPEVEHLPPSEDKPALPGTFVAKPGAITAPIVAMDQVPSPLQSEALPVNTKVDIPVKTEPSIQPALPISVQPSAVQAQTPTPTPTPSPPQVMAAPQLPPPTDTTIQDSTPEQSAEPDGRTANAVLAHPTPSPIPESSDSAEIKALFDFEIAGVTKPVQKENVENDLDKKGIERKLENSE